MNFLEIITKLFGNKQEKDIRAIQPIVDQVKAAYATIDALSNDELRARSWALMDKLQAAVADKKARIAELKASIEETPIEKREKIYNEVDKLEKEIKDKYEEVLKEILPEAFAIVKSAARRFAENETVEVTATQMDKDLAADPRYDFIDIIGGDNLAKAVYHNHWMAGGNEITWDMVHYDVQLFGGVVLHQGKIAEMATGEGKTLVATLPVYLNALTHEGVHVVTVNDYLAKRDCEWNDPLYQFLGLSVDCIDRYKPNSDERRKAYACDITFGTNNEFGFDYLRDNMAVSPLDLVQRGHNFAIVDEVDSVLIDDARTPLIISGPVPRGEDQMFDEYKDRVANLVRQQTTLTTKLLAEAKAKMGSEDEKVREEGELALFRSFKGMPKSKALIKYLSEPGIKVRLQKTEEFYLQENEKNMHIATDELYFVIDEKNKSIELTDKVSMPSRARPTTRISSCCRMWVRRWLNWKVRPVCRPKRNSRRKTISSPTTTSSPSACIPCTSCSRPTRSSRKMLIISSTAARSRSWTNRPAVLWKVVVGPTVCTKRWRRKRT